MDLRLLVQLLIRGGVIHPDEHVAAAPVDDILHLGPVEVHGGVLFLLDVQQLLCIGLGVLVHLQVAVADGDERETHLIKVAHAVVGDVPTQHIVPNLIVVVALFLPLLRSKVTEGWQGEAVLLHHLLHLFQSGVNLTAFHGMVSLLFGLFCLLIQCITSRFPLQRLLIKDTKTTYARIFRSVMSQEEP